MKKLAFIFLFISSPVWSITETQANMKPNRAYMQFFLADYLPWHESRFKSDFYNLPLPGGELFIKKAVSLIDHWKIQQDSRIDQLLIGESFRKGKKEYSYRLFIHPELRTHPFLSQKFPEKAPSFIEWDNQGKICFLFTTEPSSVLWHDIPKVKDARYFEHRCKTGSSYKIKSYSMVTNENIEWKNPFLGASYEIRTYSEEGVDSVFYYVRSTNFGKIPSHHYYYINSHGEKALLPFDKYSVDKNGSLTIYYP